MSERTADVSLRTVFKVCFGVLAVVALVYAVLSTQLAITVTILAAMLAVALQRPVGLLQRWGLPRGVAILVVVLLIAGVGALLAILLIPPAVSQAEVLATEAPRLVDRIRHTHAFAIVEKRVHIDEAIGRLAQDAPSWVFHLVNSVLGLVAAVVSTVILAIFMLIFGAPLIESWLVGLDFEPRRRERLRRVLGNIYASVGGYVGGITLICTINTLFTTAFLAIMRVPYFLPLAILSGFSSLIPYVGSIATTILISLVALASLGPWQALACVIYFVTYGQVEGNVFSPLIFRRTVHVNPLVTLLALLFFGEMAGVLGAILAIPVVAAVQVILREILLARRLPMDD